MTLFRSTKKKIDFFRAGRFFREAARSKLNPPKQVAAAARLPDSIDYGGKWELEIDVKSMPVEL